MEADSAEQGCLKLTVKIVAAYVSNNTISPDDVVKLTCEIYHTLHGLVKKDTVHATATRSLTPQTASSQQAMLPIPFVKPEESVFPEFIICLEDGRKLKTLRRHLNSAYNMTPEQYRAKWNLDANYPMVAPNYSHTRARLAREARLGGSAQERPAEKLKRKKR